MKLNLYKENFNPDVYCFSMETTSIATIDDSTYYLRFFIVKGKVRGGLVSNYIFCLEHCREQHNEMYVFDIRDLWEMEGVARPDDHSWEHSVIDASNLEKSLSLVAEYLRPYMRIIAEEINNFEISRAIEISRTRNDENLAVIRKNGEGRYSSYDDLFRNFVKLGILRDIKEKHFSGFVVYDTDSPLDFLAKITRNYLEEIEGITYSLESLKRYLIDKGFDDPDDQKPLLGPKEGIVLSIDHEDIFAPEYYQECKLKIVDQRYFGTEQEYNERNSIPWKDEGENHRVNDIGIARDILRSVKIFQIKSFQELMDITHALNSEYETQFSIEITPDYWKHEDDPPHLRFLDNN